MCVKVYYIIFIALTSVYYSSAYAKLLMKIIIWQILTVIN